MSQFCNQCLVECGILSPAEFDELPADLRDLAGLCEKGKVAYVLCEGCGPVRVDHKGNRLPPFGPQPREEARG